VDREDLKEAAEHGEEKTKNSLKEYWASQVDIDIETEKKNKGFDKLAGMFEALQSSEEEFPKVKEAMISAARKRKELCDHLIAICDKDPDNLQKINRYFGSYGDAPTMVKKYVDSMDGLNQKQFEYNFTWAQALVINYSPQIKYHNELTKERKERDDGYNSYAKTKVINPEIFIQFAVKVWDVDLSFREPEEIILEGVRRLEAFYREMGLPTRLKEVGIGTERLKEMAQKAVVWGPIGGLKKLTAKDVLAIYQLALE